MVKNPSKAEISADRAHYLAVKAWFVPGTHVVYSSTDVGYVFIEDSSGDLVGNFYEEKKGPGK
jgi:hypothetical protein